MKMLWRYGASERGTLRMAPCASGEPRLDDNSHSDGTYRKYESSSLHREACDKDARDARIGSIVIRS
jgi:hypothetical protein